MPSEKEIFRRLKESPDFHPSQDFAKKTKWNLLQKSGAMKHNKFTNSFPAYLFSVAGFILLIFMGYNLMSNDGIQLSTNNNNGSESLGAVVEDQDELIDDNNQSILETEELKHSDDELEESKEDIKEENLEINYTNGLTEDIISSLSMPINLQEEFDKVVGEPIFRVIDRDIGVTVIATYGEGENELWVSESPNDFNGIEEATKKMKSGYEGKDTTLKEFSIQGYNALLEETQSVNSLHVITKEKIFSLSGRDSELLIEVANLIQFD